MYSVAPAYALRYFLIASANLSGIILLIVFSFSFLCFVIYVFLSLFLCLIIYRFVLSFFVFFRLFVLFMFCDVPFFIFFSGAMSRMPLHEGPAIEETVKIMEGKQGE